MVRCLQDFEWDTFTSVENDEVGLSALFTTRAIQCDQLTLTLMLKAQ